MVPGPVLQPSPFAALSHITREPPWPAPKARPPAKSCKLSFSDSSPLEETCWCASLHLAKSNFPRSLGLGIVVEFDLCLRLVALIYLYADASCGRRRRSYCFLGNRRMNHRQPWRQRRTHFI